MKVIPMFRGTGKTILLLKEMDKIPSSVLVVATPALVASALRQSRAIGLDIDKSRIFSVAQVLSGALADHWHGREAMPTERKVFVDELEITLSLLLGGSVVTATSNAETFTLGIPAAAEQRTTLAQVVE